MDDCTICLGYDSIHAMVLNAKSLIILSFVPVFLNIDYSNQKQTEADSFKIQLAAIVVNDLDSSFMWYQNKLGFEVEKPIENYPDYNLRLAFLKKNGFHLELVEKAGSIPLQEAQPENTNLGGVLKLGFLVDDLDGLYNKLSKDDEVELLTTIGDLPEMDLSLKWPKRYFLITDPDGNLVQIFSYDDDKLQGNDFIPWLAMITVMDLDQAIEWYQQNLGFEFHKSVGEPGNRRAILERNNNVLELFEPSDVKVLNEFPLNTDIQGFRKLAFKTMNFDQVVNALQTSSASFVMNPNSIDSKWASKATIVKDPEGNWIQIYAAK